MFAKLIPYLCHVTNKDEPFEVKTHSNTGTGIVNNHYWLGQAFSLTGYYLVFLSPPPLSLLPPLSFLSPPPPLSPPPLYLSLSPSSLLLLCPLPLSISPSLLPLSSSSYLPSPSLSLPPPLSLLLLSLSLSLSLLPTHQLCHCICLVI